MDVALRDDLLGYMAQNARDTIAVDAPEIVMVAELHARMRNNLGAARTPAMLRVVRELLADLRFRYFGNESFQNAGPARSAIRYYWERAVLPPGFGERMRKWRCASGTFRMNVALSELPDFTALPGRQLDEHHTAGIIIGPSLGYMEQAYFDARSIG